MRLSALVGQKPLGGGPGILKLPCPGFSITLALGNHQGTSGTEHAGTLEIEKVDGGVSTGSTTALMSCGGKMDLVLQSMTLMNPQMSDTG